MYIGKKGDLRISGMNLKPPAHNAIRYDANDLRRSGLCSVRIGSIKFYIDMLLINRNGVATESAC